MSTWSNPHIGGPDSSPPDTPSTESPGFMKSLRGRASTTWKGISDSLHRATRGVFQSSLQNPDDDAGVQPEARTRSNTRGSVFTIFSSPPQTALSPFQRSSASPKVHRRGPNLFDKLNKLSTLRRKHKSSPSLGAHQRKPSERRSVMSMEWAFNRASGRPLSDSADETLPGHSSSRRRGASAEFTRLDVSPPEITGDIPSYKLEELSYRASMETEPRPGTADRFSSPTYKTVQVPRDRSQQIHWQPAGSRLAALPSPDYFDMGSYGSSTFVSSLLDLDLEAEERAEKAAKKYNVYEDGCPNSLTSSAALRDERFSSTDLGRPPRPRSPIPNMGVYQGNADLVSLRSPSPSGKSQWMKDEAGHMHFVTCHDGVQRCLSQTCGAGPSSRYNSASESRKVSWPDPSREHTLTAQKAAREALHAVLLQPQPPSKDCPCHDDLCPDGECWAIRQTCPSPMRIRNTVHEAELVNAETAQQSVVEALQARVDSDLASNSSSPGPTYSEPWTAPLSEPMRALYETPSGYYGKAPAEFPDESDECSARRGKSGEESEGSSVRKFSFDPDLREHLSFVKDLTNGPTRFEIVSDRSASIAKSNRLTAGGGLKSEALPTKTVHPSALAARKNLTIPQLSSLPSPAIPVVSGAVSEEQQRPLIGDRQISTRSIVTPTSCAVSTQPEEYFAPLPSPAHHRHTNMGEAVCPDQLEAVPSKGEQKERAASIISVASTAKEGSKMNTAMPGVFAESLTISQSPQMRQFACHDNSPIKLNSQARPSPGRNSPSKLPQFSSGPKATPPTRIATPYTQLGIPRAKSGSLGTKHGSPTSQKTPESSTKSKSGIPSPSRISGPYSKVPSLTQHRHTTCVGTKEQEEDDEPPGSEWAPKRVARGSPVSKQASKSNLKSLRQTKSIGRI